MFHGHIQGIFLVHVILMNNRSFDGAFFHACSTHSSRSTKNAERKILSILNSDVSLHRNTENKNKLLKLNK